MKLASENGSHLIPFKSTFHGLLTAVNRGKTRPPSSSQNTVLLWTLLISQHFNSPRPNAFILCYRTEAESRWKGTRMLSSHLLTARLTASMGRGPQTSKVREESHDQAERGRGGREVEMGREWHIRDQGPKPAGFPARTFGPLWPQGSWAYACPCHHDLFLPFALLILFCFVVSLVFLLFLIHF